MPVVTATSTKPVASSGLARLGRLLLRRVWLPDSVYASLPWMYMLAGLGCTLAALFVEHWSWIVPYLLLLGIGCIHAALLVLTLRRKRTLERDVAE